VAGTAYTLCLFALPSGDLLTHARAPGGESCGGRPCWGVRGSGFRYSDRERSHGGLRKITLAAGGTGRVRARVEASGPVLALPALPLQLPLGVQLVADGGACWEATFSASGARLTGAEQGFLVDVTGDQNPDYVFTTDIGLNGIFVWPGNGGLDRGADRDRRPDGSRHHHALQRRERPGSHVPLRLDFLC
jgi:hypothetical protein